MTKDWMCCVVINLSMIQIGEEAVIKKVDGREEQRLFLENLGFVPGSRATVINSVDGNLIVNIKESRVALGREMALRIVV